MDISVSSDKENRCAEIYEYLIEICHNELMMGLHFWIAMNINLVEFKRGYFVHFVAWVCSAYLKVSVMALWKFIRKIKIEKKWMTKYLKVPKWGKVVKKWVKTDNQSGQKVQNLSNDSGRNIQV